MDPIGWLEAVPGWAWAHLSWVPGHLGLVVFTVIVAALIGYLGYAMVRPDRF